ncbi:MAG: 50S ribosomal protein L11 methyltransferase [Halobacteriovoraceae bacterium]|nr:50S ribosomal protein L11 methyltransferase [Halobacteriovoraceae bacterium]
MEMIYFVTVDFVEESLSTQELDAIAIGEYESLGKVEFDIDEAKVDEILGKDAYCGGDIPEAVMQKLQDKLSEENSFKYFWQKKSNAEAFLKKVKELGLKAKLEEKEAEDWNQSWRESFKTIPVSEELSVVPSWEKTEDDKNKVFIYPGMGFGTGNHETTFLCLSLFEKVKDELPKAGRCLDFGCGSGILGIAAVKKKEMVVDFVDIDTDALDNCVMNLEFNDFNKYQEGHGIVVRDRYKVEEPYELVFANILENILQLEKNLILESLKERGFLIVSGLLKDQEKTILDEYSSLNHVETVTKGDWIAILFKKES